MAFWRLDRRDEAIGMLTEGRRITADLRPLGPAPSRPARLSLARVDQKWNLARAGGGTGWGRRLANERLAALGAATSFTRWSHRLQEWISTPSRSGVLAAAVDATDRRPRAGRFDVPVAFFLSTPTRVERPPYAGGCPCVSRSEYPPQPFARLLPEALAHVRAAAPLTPRVVGIATMPSQTFTVRRWILMPFQRLRVCFELDAPPPDVASPTVARGSYSSGACLLSTIIWANDGGVPGRRHLDQFNAVFGPYANIARATIGQAISRTASR